MKFTLEISFQKSKPVEVKASSGWIPLVTLSQLPQGENFLLYDKKATSGLCIYEAMKFDNGQIGCPATTEEFHVADFSHWRPMIELP